MSSSSLPRETLLLGVLMVVAFALRVGYLFERQAAPDFAHPEVDAAFHDDWARSMVYGRERAGEWRRADHGEPLLGEPYLRPPGYPWFLAAVYAVSGGSETAAVIANQVCGLLTMLLAFLIARRLAGGAAGLVAAGVLGLHWASIFYEGELHAPPLLGLLELSMVYALLRARAGGLAWCAAAGAALGAAALVRPNALIFLGVALPWLWWTARRRDVSWVRPVLVTGAAAVVAILPATIRNWRVAGEFVPITANLGINLYLGNHEGATGLIRGELGELGAFRTCYDYPSVVARLEEKLGGELGLSDVSAYFGGEAIDWITSDFGGFLGVTWTKARYLVGPTEVGHNKEVAFEKRGSSLLRFLPFSFPALLGLALAGALLGWRRSEEDEASDPSRREGVLLLAGCAVAFALSLLPFFAAARYRVPIVPLAAPLIGLVATAGRLDWRHGAGVAAIALAWVLGPVQEVGQDLGAAKYHLGRAQGYFSSGDFARCRDEYDLVLALTPNDPGVLYGLGNLEQAEGQARRAEGNLEQARAHERAAVQHYRAVLRSEPGHTLANFNLGFLLRDQNDPEGALAVWQAATDSDPLFVPAAIERGMLLLRMNRPRRAVADLALAVERAGATPPDQALFVLAGLLATSPDDGLRDPDEALALGERALAAGLDEGAARQVRAAALAELGRFPEAIQEAQAALAVVTDPDQRAALQAALSRFRAGKTMRSQ